MDRKADVMCERQTFPVNAFVVKDHSQGVEASVLENRSF
jgi:hypothetical protein